MQIVCTTVRTVTCVSHQVYMYISELRKWKSPTIFQLFSKNFIATCILSIITRYQILDIIIIYIELFLYYFLIQLFSKNSTLSNGYGRDYNAVWVGLYHDIHCISILYRNIRCAFRNLNQIPNSILVKSRTFLS